MAYYCGRGEFSAHVALTTGYVFPGAAQTGENAAILAEGDNEYWYWNAGISKTFKEKFTFDVHT